MCAASILQSIADRLTDRAVFSLAVRRRLLSRKTLERLRSPGPEYDPRLPTVITACEELGILIRCGDTTVSTVRTIVDGAQLYMDSHYLTVGQLAKRVGVSRSYLFNVMTTAEHRIGLYLSCRLARCYSDGLEAVPRSP